MTPTRTECLATPPDLTLNSFEAAVNHLEAPSFRTVTLIGLLPLADAMHGIQRLTECKVVYFSRNSESEEYAWAKELLPNDFSWLVMHNGHVVYSNPPA